MQTPVLARIVPCSLGFLAVATTEIGVCAVRLGDDETSLRETLDIEYSNLQFVDHDARLNTFIEAITRELSGESEDRVLDVPLDLRGTDFQREVWRALQTVPRGETRTYTQLAQMVGKPSAVRAVASACAANGIALLVPCHRIVRRDGSLSDFRWDTSRKAKLLQLEGAIPQAETRQLSLL